MPRFLGVVLQPLLSELLFRGRALGLLCDADPMRETLDVI